MTSIERNRGDCPPTPKFQTRAGKLPDLSADLLLLHPPAFFDFRTRRDVYFPFLGTSGDVPITPLYEHFPLGFKSIERYLTNRGISVKILNLCTLLLCYPGIEFRSVIDSFDVRLLGIDLHWLVHVQGSLAVAEEIKKIRRGIPILFGGISTTYYAKQLIGYHAIDMVMRGYDTHEPLFKLIEARKAGKSLESVPNLLWKSQDGEIHDNGFTYTPNSYGYGIDWSSQRRCHTGSLPILEFLSTQNAGCSFDCGWCGGSASAFKRTYNHDLSLVRKPENEVDSELRSITQLPDVENYHFYSVGTYTETQRRFDSLCDRIAETKLKSVSYEQHCLTSMQNLRRMARANRRTVITLSPESHDQRIGKLAGRGVYSNEELERWLEKAFECGIHQVDIWYFIGMPEQDEKSVFETVSYCQELLQRFKGERVNPLICPLIPFLDPASRFFEQPGKYGYRVFYRTIEEHRRGMGRSSIINRLNYETQWLKRHELVNVGFTAVRRLMEAKAESGSLPGSVAHDYGSEIKNALDFIHVVHEIDNLTDEKSRGLELEKLGDEIESRNKLVLSPQVMNQAFPIGRRIGGRWFDELPWTHRDLEECQS